MPRIDCPRLQYAHDRKHGRTLLADADSTCTDEFAVDHRMKWDCVVDFRFTGGSARHLLAAPAPQFCDPALLVAGLQTSVRSPPTLCTASGNPSLAELLKGKLAFHPQLVGWRKKKSQPRCPN
jgi:hypothetical protein